jgi:aryl-alcohol dehydrogenase-like predicted oxidoreductase
MHNIVIGGSKFDTLSQKELNKFLDYALTLGVYQIDTSPNYGKSEEMIGNYQKLNPQLTIYTKVGFPKSHANKWKPSDINNQLENSLLKLNVANIDTLFFHSVPFHLLRKEIFSTIEQLKAKQLILNLGYSGDNEDLKFATNLNNFDCFMVTFNAIDVLDYEFIKNLDNKKIFIKRPIANAVFNRTLMMRLKSKVKNLMVSNENLYPNSYPSRYKKIFGEPKSIDIELTNFIQFLVKFQPQAKYVFGVRTSSHLKEIVKIYKIVSSQVLPELDDYLKNVTDISHRFNWRTLS